MGTNLIIQTPQLKTIEKALAEGNVARAHQLIDDAFRYGNQSVQFSMDYLMLMALICCRMGDFENGRRLFVFEVHRGNGFTTDMEARYFRHLFRGLIDTNELKRARLTLEQLEAYHSTDAGWVMMWSAGLKLAEFRLLKSREDRVKCISDAHDLLDAAMEHWEDSDDGGARWRGRYLWIRFQAEQLSPRRAKHSIKSAIAELEAHDPGLARKARRLHRWWWLH